MRVKGAHMPTLTIFPNETGVRTPEERAHNKPLLERYMPDFPAYYLEAKEELGAQCGPITIEVPDSDLEFVRSVMDGTKHLQL